MAHQFYTAAIVLLAHGTVNRLMVNIRQKTIQKAAGCVVRIAGRIRQCMMHMVRYGIDLFRNNFEGKVLRKKTPETITERISAMRAIAVMPYGAMCTHNNHTIHKGNYKQLKSKVFKDEQKQERGQHHDHHPAHKREPVFFVLKYV